MKRKKNRVHDMRPSIPRNGFEAKKGLKLPGGGSPANQMGKVFVGGAISYQIARQRNTPGDIRN